MVSTGLIFRTTRASVQDTHMYLPRLSHVCGLCLRIDKPPEAKVVCLTPPYMLLWLHGHHHPATLVPLRRVCLHAVESISASFLPRQDSLGRVGVKSHC